MTDLRLTSLLDLELRRLESVFDAQVLGGGGSAARDRIRRETVVIADAVLDGWDAGLRELTPAQVARLLVGLQDVVARDCVAVVDPTQLSVAIALWGWLAAQAPPSYAAPPWCVRALLRWQAGDERGAVDDALRSLEDDDDYAMAGLLLQSCAGGLRPTDLFGDPGPVADRRQRLLRPQSR